MDKFGIKKLKWLKYNFMSDKKLYNILEIMLYASPNTVDVDEHIYVADVLVRRERKRGTLPELKSRKEFLEEADLKSLQRLNDSLFNFEKRL